MSTRNTIFTEGEFYHLYNRGVDKRVIYTNQADYQRFIELLYLCNTSVAISFRDIKYVHKNVFDFERQDVLVNIGAYCLIPNHFHILLTPNVENGVSIFMGKLGTSYSMYFNRKYERSGSLFQGTFKAKHVDSDEYLKYLYAYIHLNPIKLHQSDWQEQGIKELSKAYHYAADFEYSSLPDYLGLKRNESSIINPAPFPEYFANQAEMKNELLEWLSYNLPEGSPRGETKEE